MRNQSKIQSDSNEILEEVRRITNSGDRYTFPKASRQFTRDGLIEILEEPVCIIGDERDEEESEDCS